MKLTFNICDIGKCKIRITDYTQDSEEYLPEDVLDEEELQSAYVNNRFKYSYTCTINIIQYTSLEKSEIKKVIITPHDVFLDETYYQTEQDGFYTIHHFVLPNVFWLEEELSKEHNFLDNDIAVFVTDGKFIYQYVKDKLIKKDPEVLIMVNPEDTTISKEVKTVFQICKLYNCYINLCKKLLNLPLKRCANEYDDSSDLIFKRDFIWMTINVIKYYTQYDQLYEAQRILEMVNYCNNFCQDDYKNPSKTSKCGCN